MKFKNVFPRTSRFPENFFETQNADFLKILRLWEVTIVIRIKNKKTRKETGKKLLIMERILARVRKTSRNKKMIQILFPHHLAHKGIQLNPPNLSGSMAEASSPRRKESTR